MKRIVLKVGSSSLTDEAGQIAQEKFDAIAAAVLTGQARGLRFALVTSGAVACGRALLGRDKPKSLAEKQAFAAAGQAQLMQHWALAFRPHLNVAQFLLSAADIQHRARFVNAKQALEAAFKFDLLPIINENDTVATAELKVGDNDSLSAWVAYLVDAQALLLLTDVDGLFDCNPKTHPHAVRIVEVADLSKLAADVGGAGSKLGTGGMRTKLKAAQIACDAGVETWIFSGGGAGVARWLAGEKNGTRFAPKAAHRSARSAWILHQRALGALVVDAGAASALIAGRSLLASGVRAVDGDFGAHSAVAIKSPSGEILAHGICELSARDVGKILGLHSDQLQGALGFAVKTELIHRDQLALVALPGQTLGLS
jgi:glutamate 5-kinase